MERIMKLFGLAALLFLSVPSFANDWSQATKVAEINTGYTGGFILFRTEKAHHNPKNCDAAFYAVRQGDAEVDQILSVLLAAQKSGGSIQVGVNSSKCDQHGRISVTRIRSLP